ncbi:RICIN domain-containing protein [Algibacillus agarilyticus]|uniref:RICIN domain-containing protein n=1 Tax=Algibacillus agarilyticus TaxID=2234133 RepID=UPI000DCFEDD6|nr:RICIN domain-containing protein [Algibacillus agarilyticus]
MIKIALLTSSILLTCSALAADWDNVAIPADAGAGNTWKLQSDFSDDFNYSGKNNSFTSKWNDTYLNDWTGPGLTHWTSDSSAVWDGNLVIGASRRAGTNKVNTGVVTSKNTVKYPVFLEANIKVSNLELSSNFWLLSKNDKREIDILEVYGGARDTWFAKNMGTNFHLFFRDSQTNEITNDFTGHTNNTPSTGTYWRERFHRFGAYWKSPTEVTFYIDGQKTADGSWAQSVLKDKAGTILDKSQYNMDEELHIILDTEDHVWRSRQGIIATDADLADNSKNKMYVDWIRVYKPVATGGAGNVPTGFTHLQVKHSNKCLDLKDGSMINGGTYQQWGCNSANLNQRFKFNHLGNGEYSIQSERSMLCAELANGSSANGALVNQWVCNHANNNHKWTLKDTGDGYFEIRSKVTGKCLDVAGKSTDNGVKIVQWNCFNGTNQRFKFL